MSCHSSILYQNKEKNIVLLDLPKSLEEAQVLPDKLTPGWIPPRRLVSTKPVETPFAIPEPKKTTASVLHPSAQVSELMTGAAVSHALEELRKAYTGRPWCLPRVYNQSTAPRESHELRKRKLDDGEDDLTAASAASDVLFLPEGSDYLLGSVESQREAFLAKAPEFDLIILDPPWPNRSVRRKKGSYAVADSLDGIRQMLSHIPIAAHLASDGLVAVWVTNRPSILEHLKSPHGLFAECGLELVDEWTWVKVTTSGEPIYAIDSQWRKPWERLLIAGRPGQARQWVGKGKVVIAVPELHSRKPNMRPLFEDLLPSNYNALEVFARNLTAGWWSWGDEVLKFQSREHWISHEPEGI